MMDNKIKSYLTFKIGNENFGANVSHVQNIIEYSKLTRVPEMPSFVLGVLNLRGDVLPVIDSRIKLGVPASEITDRTCIIVVEMFQNGNMCKTGFLVDEVSEVLEINEQDIMSPPLVGKTLREDVITGLFPIDNKFIMLLDITRILEANDIIDIAIATE